MAKRNIPKAFFEPFEEVESSNLLENDSLLKMIKTETPVAIGEAFKDKKTFATIFEIGNTGYHIDIPKQYWIDALEQCINYNLEEEKFEDCIPIKNLIDEIRKPIKKVTKSKQHGTGTDGDTDSNQPDAKHKKSSKKKKED